jgi:Protein of unknown function (DUF2637)
VRTDCTKKPMPSELRVFPGRPRWCALTNTQHVIKWSTACAVADVAAIAAVASYEHAYALVRVHGEAGWTGRLVPLTVDGLIYASSMVMLDSARRKTSVPALARWLLGLGIAATLAANVAHGLGHGPIGAAVAAWPVIPCRSKRLRCSPSSLRRTGFPQFVRSALSSTSASPEHTGCETISPQVKSRKENIAA